LDRRSARLKAATYTQNKRTQTSMSRVGFEPTNPVFEWAKTCHALDRAASVIGLLHFYINRTPLICDNVRKVEHRKFLLLYLIEDTETYCPAFITSFLVPNKLK
jgi:hypothetical protein